MKRIILIALMLTVMHSSILSQSRWRDTGGYKWDTLTSVKIDQQRVRLFTISELISAQRDYMTREKLYPQQIIDRIAHERAGVVLNCKANESGFFSITYLSQDMTPVAPGTNIKMSDLEMEPIAPDTNMEDLAKDVCSFHRIK